MSANWGNLTVGGAQARSTGNEGDGGNGGDGGSGGSGTG